MNTQQMEKRNLLSGFFVTLLIGLAYQEMIACVKGVLQTNAFNYQIIFLPAIFFFVSVRFFVGNQLHLLGDTLLKLPGLAWLYDLMVIIVQCIVLVLLGGVASVEANRAAPIKFLDLLILLYVIDVLWVASQWGLGKALRSWRRPFVPWAWAILNTVLIVLLFVLDRIFGDAIYSAAGRTCLLVLNVLGFLVDVVLVDYYDVV
jgi:hypothetical protein